MFDFHQTNEASLASPESNATRIQLCIKLKSNQLDAVTNDSILQLHKRTSFRIFSKFVHNSQ